MTENKTAIIPQETLREQAEELLKKPGRFFHLRDG